MSKLRLAAAALAFAVPVPLVVAAAPDGTRGMAIMSAVVASNGEPVHMAGVTATQRFSTGNYRVTFVRAVDLAACAFSVTPFAGIATMSYIEDERTAIVQAYHPTDGTFLDAGFSIIAFCHK